ncbi:MAG TPA: helix-turn-helix domain-containing protein [Candidatus Bathyarchaeia archaeon]|nr:helix-turn-helix domain-containing protein [Candidatus Bathyarchaeia archaeon]
MPASQPKGAEAFEGLRNAEKLMRQLGFSEGEYTIYFSLLDKPSGEPIDAIVGRSGISSSDAERAINGLVDKGLVRVSSNKLEASEPKQFIARIQDIKRLEASRNLESITEASSRLLSLIEPRFWEVRLGVRPEDILEPLPTLEEMEVRTVRVIGDSRKKVLISAESFSWFVKIQEEAYQASERGVKFRVLMSTKDHEALSRAREASNMGMSVRTHQEDWYPVRGTLGDDSQLVFLIWATQDKGPKPKYFRPHYSRNVGMIRVFADAFEKRWAEAKPI